MGVSENVVYPIVPNGFADHYPMKNGFFIGNIAYFQTNPNDCLMALNTVYGF